MRHLFAVVLGTVFAAGCLGAVGEEGTGGDDDPVNPSGKMGQTVYTKDVHAALNKCSGGACHSSDAVSGALGKFYVPDAAAGYARIVAAPTIIGDGAQAFSSVAPVLSHIAAGHKGIAYTSDEI